MCSSTACFLYRQFSVIRHVTHSGAACARTRVPVTYLAGPSYRLMAYVYLRTLLQLLYNHQCDDARCLPLDPDIFWRNRALVGQFERLGKDWGVLTRLLGAWETTCQEPKPSLRKLQSLRYATSTVELSSSDCFDLLMTFIIN